jgi:hypothetical protein
MDKFPVFRGTAVPPGGTDTYPRQTIPPMVI